MIRYARFATPIGTLLGTTTGDALTGLYFHGERHAPAISAGWIEDADAKPFDECRRQLRGRVE